MRRQDAARPGAGQPGDARPGADPQDAAQPGAGQPGDYQPAAQLAGQPGVSQPVVPQPIVIGQSRANQLETAGQRMPEQGPANRMLPSQELASQGITNPLPS